MIDADAVEERGRPPRPRAHPLEAGALHRRPAPRRQPPVLPGVAERVGRHADGGVEHELLLAGPHVGAVARHHERQVAEHPHAGRGPRGLPLPFGDPLQVGAVPPLLAERQRRPRAPPPGSAIGQAPAASPTTPVRRARRGWRGTSHRRRATTTRGLRRRETPPPAGCRAPAPRRRSARYARRSHLRLERAHLGVADARRRPHARPATRRSPASSAASPPSAAKSSHVGHADVDRIERHRRHRRIGRGLARRDLVQRQELHVALSGGRAPRAERRQVGELADAPAARGHQREQRHADAALAHGGGVTARPATRASSRAMPASNTAGSGSRLTHHERLAREVEEVAGVHQHAVVLDQRRAPAPPRSPVAGTCSTARPAARRLVQRHRRRRRARPRRSASRFRADPRRDLRAHRRADAQQLGERQLRRRRHRQERVGDDLEAVAAPRPPRRPGPTTPIHATFTCGSPTDFDRPPSPKASARDCCSTETPAAAARERIVGEHLVADERHAARGGKRGQRLELRRRSSVEPVGLLGETTSTALVRASMAAATAATSSRQPSCASSA